MGFVELMVAILMIIVALSTKPDLLRIKPLFLLKGMILISLVGLIKYVIFAVFMRAIPPGMMEFLVYVNPMDLMFVFLEDAFYTLPLIIMDEYKNKFIKYIKYLLFPILCLMFASGHLYQGWQGFFFSLFYIPITYKIAKENGLGTIMLLHTFWDVVLFFTALQIASSVLQ